MLDFFINLLYFIFMSCLNPLILNMTTKKPMFVGHNIQKMFNNDIDYQNYRKVFNTDGYLTLNYLSCNFSNEKIQELLIINKWKVIPCGMCEECLKDRRRQWTQRNIIESKKYENKIFLTLTYDDRYISSEFGTLSDRGFMSLNKKHLSDFIKRLRSDVDRNSSSKYCFANSTKIRFFACGEYGDKNFRPHYHILLYNFDILPHLKKFYKETDGIIYYTSDIITRLWPYGFHIIGEMTDYDIAYTSGYVTKKIDKNLKSFYKKSHIEPEFTLMSRKPGIGYTDDYKKFYDNDNMLYRFGEKRFFLQPLKYYDYLLKKNDEEFFEHIKSNRSKDYVFGKDTDETILEYNIGLKELFDKGKSRDNMTIKN